MASISSLMSGSTSSANGSFYGKTNMISGLASGMDTEAMIETAVSGLKNRLASLNQDMTKLEWEQTAYRGITDSLIDFSSKYLSYDNNTNLMSASFFDSSVKTKINGTYADMITVAGSSSSDFEILGATKAKDASFSGISDAVKAKLADKEYNSSLTMADLGIAAGATLTMGDKEITVEADTTIGSLLSKIKSDFGIDASYSTATKEFYLKSQKSGTAGNFELGGTLATALFGEADGVISAEGAKAKLVLNINGKDNFEIEQDSNVFDIDGMKVTVRDTFTVDKAAGQSAVTLTTSVDSDKIVDAIKGMVNDFNKLATGIKDAYTTKPAKTSKGTSYEPLTEEQAKDMSDEAIKNYEEKAKQGLLFADSDLSALHTELVNAFGSYDLSKIGITTEFANGKTTLALDEKKLREAVETDIDTVKNVLNREAKDGDQGGAMVALKKTVDRYAETMGSKKGILVERAGTEKASWTLNDNDYKRKMEEMQEQVSRWETKLTNKVDYYVKQFTALEKMISQMNAQSSALSGMMGY